MIPSIVARQARETVLDYLRTTFALADAKLEKALFEFLDGENGLFKGPYVDIRLPFRKADPGERIPLDIRPSFEPYKHQLKAFQRLYSKDGHQPQHTLVTTGTGSGKTECFLYPILDHCFRHREQQGVKAILLYPMNALASDQARRIAQLLWDDERLRGKVTAGLYVGGKGQHGAADRDHLVDKRDVLRDSPPDILLTNYKMLDFLLLRPEDRRLWKFNGPDTLRYLVLDELHTYDGAQGSDVACLIRRLKQRLGCAPGSVCAVGTSATIGGGIRRNTLAALTGFASKVFDEDFFEDSVVTEDRLEAAEALGELVSADQLPGRDEVRALDPEAFDDCAAWLRRQAELWFGDDGGSLTTVEVGRRLERHDFLRQLLKVLGGSLKTLAEIDAGLAARVPAWESFAVDERRQLLESFLGLLSSAKRPAPTPDNPDRTEPFLTVQVQLWIRELRHLVRKVLPMSEPPVFSWEDEGLPRTPGRPEYWLPLAYCRECGSSGLATFQKEGEQKLETTLQAIGMRWLNRSRWCRFVRFGHPQLSETFPEYVCPQCLRVQLGAECDVCGVGDRRLAAEPVETIPVVIESTCSDQTPPHFLAQCPDCGSDRALSMLGSRAPSLLSVAISRLYQSDFNQDKKLLAFTDSVQDASHRAGFFGARTYRFNLRTAIQKVIDDSAEAIPLSELADRMWDYWAAKMQANRLIPTLLPADLRELDSYLRFLEKGGAGSNAKLEGQLRQRLSWEAVMEFGLNARVGRTLESTLCSTVEVDPGAIREAAAVLQMELEENAVLPSLNGRPPGIETIEHFLSGFLHRLRLRGGVDHPLLKTYIRENGNWFHLTKRKNPLMSPFRRESVLPRFITDRVRAAREEAVFDSFFARPKPPLTWTQDWAARVFGIEPTDPGINDLYRETLKRLEGSGVLVRHDLTRQGSAWGLDPSRLHATTSVAQVVCPECRRQVTLSREEASRWQRRACTRYRCRGLFASAEEQTKSYYGKIYRSGRLERIFSTEHTGLLLREDREQIEDDFKSGTKPGAPNLFVCTPTLEMGIDIGDLSAAMLCSVPPSTTHYLQRIGRAGRKTGNAFVLTLANSRPHDLYFYDEPLEMMAGQVLPPGCFLDAPDMLRRQIVAHAMDGWAAQEDELKSIPNQTGFILGDAGKASFPGRFIEFYRKNREALTKRFLDTFESHLSGVNREHLAEFANGEFVPELVEGAFRLIETELKELRNEQVRAKTRLQEIEKNPESVEDAEEAKADLEETRKLIGRLMLELRNKYPLNVLTDEGVLPNYAFPEPGVRLQSVIGSESNGQRTYEAKEYVRPASSAIRELAPFNTFYAEGRKVRIDEIDIGSQARPMLEGWRFCPECSHMRRELAEQGVESGCPRCGDLNWTDAGQLRTLVHFRRSRSLATRLEASTVDDSDDREETFYETLDLIDVGKEHYNGAKLIEELPFGYELLKKLKLREVNFGPDGPPSGQGLRVCAQPVSDRGFEVCKECGRVRDRRNEIRHSATCKAKRAATEEKTESIFLYREVESEAIRILLPVSEVGLEGKRASFKAALQLGFRRHFEGDPGHLIIRSVREPVRGGLGVRQFLVVFDGVPGGTGYLSELWRESHFLDVLQKALDALQSCSCQRNPNKDGCYRCLFAYQHQRDLPIISSRSAQDTLRSILSLKDRLKDVLTLSEVTLETQIESELEEKFIQALRARADATKGIAWEEIVKGGEIRWILRTEAQAWEIQAQVDLGASQGVMPACRPDFLIRPANADPAVRPVAVFCDGLAYHVCPDKPMARIADDIEKRTGIIESGRYQVWSLTWKDVSDFEESSAANSAATMFASLDVTKLGQIGQAKKLELARSLGQSGSMEMLLSYLRNPNITQWRTLADTYALAWLLSAQSWDRPEHGTDLEARMTTEAGRFSPGPMETVGHDAPVLVRHQFLTWMAMLARSSRDSLKNGRVERVRIRLFDEAAARVDADFEGNWRTFLHAWNLLQFHEGTTVLSSEGIDNAPYAAAASGSKLAVADDFAPENSRTPELARLLEFATEWEKTLILEIVRNGLPLPVNDFELPADGPGCGPEPSLAWPQIKVAALATRQAEDRDEFVRQAWTVFVEPVDVAQLIDAIRTFGSEKAEGGSR